MTTARDLIKTSGRILGWLAAGDDPTADEGIVALAGLNRLKRTMFGVVIGPKLSPQPVTGTTGQAENGGEYMIPSTAAFALTAPLNPRGGSRFGVVDAGLNWATYNLTVLPNGRQIGGSTGSTVISTNGANVRWWFRPDTGNWIAESDYATIDSVIDFPDQLTDYLPNMLAVVTAAEFSSDLRPEVISIAIEGRMAFARMYGRTRGAQPNVPLGMAPQPQQAA